MAYTGLYVLTSYKLKILGTIFLMKKVNHIYT